MRIATLGLVTALNLFLRRKLPPELFERLDGKEVAIDVRKPRFQMSFRVRGRHFEPIPPARSPVLRFSASAYDFALIAAREADPDTLFFNRRLVVEGDTELALIVKNALDNLEVPHTRKALKRVLKIAEPLSR